VFDFAALFMAVLEAHVTCGGVVGANQKSKTPGGDEEREPFEIDLAAGVYLLRPCGATPSEAFAAALQSNAQHSEPALGAGNVLALMA
jgi:hypothetical protein